MARRPFDSSFSRRADGLMREPSSSSFGGGGRGYDEEDYGGGGGSRIYNEDELFALQEAQQVYNRIPREALQGGRMKIKEEYEEDNSPSSVSGGGWRHRSPSPPQQQRYNPSKQINK
jgi:hypothetical protein